MAKRIGNILVVAGWAYYEKPNLRRGDTLLLERHLDNGYDEFAVRIFVNVQEWNLFGGDMGRHSVMCGYIPRTHSKRVALWLDANPGKGMVEVVDFLGNGVPRVRAVRNAL